MPYSDNLYSVDDDASDAGSLSDEVVHDGFSPIDGFRHQSEIAPNVMVVDPSFDAAQAEAKAREASEEARAVRESAARAASPQSNTHTHSYVSFSPTSPTRSSSRMYASAFHDDTPSSPLTAPYLGAQETPSLPSPRHPQLVSGPPPPSYSVATSTSAPQSPQSSPATHYQTFTPSQLERGFPHHMRPESMGIPVDDPYPPTETTSLLRMPNITPRRRIIQQFLLVALFLVASISFLTILLTPDDSGKQPSDKMPGSDPEHPNQPHNDWPGKGDEKTPGFERPVIPTEPFCAYATQLQDSLSLRLPIDTGLSIIQRTYNVRDDRNLKSVFTTGEIQVRRFPVGAGSLNHGYLTLEIFVSDSEIEIGKFWNEETRSLTIETPNFAKLDSTHHHCISLEITAWLPDNTELTDLLLQSSGISIRIFDDVQMNVTGETKIVSTSGDVNVLMPEKTHVSDVISHEKRFKSRRTVVRTSSGAIRGQWSLYDYLGLFSSSGDITAIVTPEEAQASDPIPAVLEIKSTSGDVETHFPSIERVAPKFTRDYITRVNTSSGDISGEFYLSSEGIFKSTSGKLKLTVFPFVDTDRASIFQTKVTSGDCRIKLMAPVFIYSDAKVHAEREIEYPRLPSYPTLPPYNSNPWDEAPSKPKFDKLHSSHKSTSGKFHIEYPEAWIGYMYAQVTSGAITAEGPDLEVIKNNHGWASRSVTARHGKVTEGEASTVEISSTSGDIGFFITNQQ